MKQIGKKADLLGSALSGLVGAGLGAGAVGGISTSINKRDEPPEERRKRIRDSLIIGALFGGVAGTGIPNIISLPSVNPEVPKTWLQRQGENAKSWGPKAMGGGLGGILAAFGLKNSLPNISGQSLQNALSKGYRVDPTGPWGVKPSGIPGAKYFMSGAPATAEDIAKAITSKGPGRPMLGTALRMLKGKIPLGMLLRGLGATALLGGGIAGGVGGVGLLQRTNEAIKNLAGGE